MWIETEVEYQIKEYLLAHKEGMKEKLLPEAKLFLDRAYMFQGPLKQPFDNAYDAFMLGLMRVELMDALNLYSEQTMTIVTKDFILDLLGEDFFNYE